MLYTTINQKVANQNNITIYMTLERNWYDKCGVRSGGCIEMTMWGEDMTRMKCQNGIGNNNTQQYTPHNYRIVWIVLDLILHTIISCGEEGIVELGDDRRGGLNNNTQCIFRFS